MMDKKIHSEGLKDRCVDVKKKYEHLSDNGKFRLLRKLNIV